MPGTILSILHALLHLTAAANRGYSFRVKNTYCISVLGRPWQSLNSTLSIISYPFGFPEGCYMEENDSRMGIK